MVLRRHNGTTNISDTHVLGFCLFSGLLELKDFKKT